MLCLSPARDQALQALRVGREEGRMKTFVIGNEEANTGAVWTRVIVRFSVMNGHVGLFGSQCDGTARGMLTARQRERRGSVEAGVFAV